MIKNIHRSTDHISTLKQNRYILLIYIRFDKITKKTLRSYYRIQTLLQKCVVDIEGSVNLRGFSVHKTRFTVQLYVFFFISQLE